jgi:hypothetical protein
MNNIATDAQSAATGNRILQRGFAIMLTQLRSVVIRSLTQLLDTFKRFGDGTPPAEGEPCVPFRVRCRVVVETPAKEGGGHKFVLEPSPEKVASVVQGLTAEVHPGAPWTLDSE